MVIDIKRDHILFKELMLTKEYQQFLMIHSANAAPITKALLQKIKDIGEAQKDPKLLREFEDDVIRMPDFADLTEALREGQPGISVENIVKIHRFILDDFPSLPPPGRGGIFHDQKLPNFLIRTQFGEFLALTHVLGQGKTKKVLRTLRLDDKEYPFAAYVGPLDRNEAQMLKQLAGSPGIVKTFGFLEGKASIFTLAEEYPFTMANLIKRKNLTLPHKKHTLQQIAQGLGHIHGHQIIHRDIKPENILVKEDGTPVISDFGLSVYTHDRASCEKLVGSPLYWAPEYFQAEGKPAAIAEATKPSLDMWAFGYMAYVLLNKNNCHPVWYNEDRSLVKELLGYVCDQNRYHWLSPNEFEPEAYAIVSSLLALDPAQRISTQALVQMLAARASP